MIQCILCVLLFRTQIEAGDSKLMWTVAWCYGMDVYISLLVWLLNGLLAISLFQNRMASNRKAPFAPVILFTILIYEVFRIVF